MWAIERSVSSFAAACLSTSGQEVSVLVVGERHAGMASSSRDLALVDTSRSEEREAAVLEVRRAQRCKHRRRSNHLYAAQSASTVTSRARNDAP